MKKIFNATLRFKQKYWLIQVNWLFSTNARLQFKRGIKLHWKHKETYKDQDKDPLLKNIFKNNLCNAGIRTFLLAA